MAIFIVKLLCFSFKIETEDDERMADDDVDSIISPGTEESVIRSSIGAQSREKQRLSGSESCINETTSHDKSDSQDKG